MWNSEAPMKLLEQMPARLNMANLERLQQVIDIDKYCASCEEGRDLCGEYAPFCSLCDKALKCPCAVAYVKMKQDEGMFIEIATEEVDVEEPETPVNESASESVDEPATESEEPVTESEEPVTESEESVTESAEEPVKEKKSGRGIRIARAVRTK